MIIPFSKYPVLKFINISKIKLTIIAYNISCLIKSTQFDSY